MNWPGPTFTDSGGFQVMSLGSGFKKVISMEATGQRSDELVAVGKERLSNVDDDGVTFKSHLDGAMHRFTPEISMRVQHEIGADIMFAFDELTTLINTRGYQEESLERTRQWAIRCVEEHFRLTEARSHRPYQALFGVLQGAQYEDLRRKAARDLGGRDFDGFGIGGAREKENLGTIIRWVGEELPERRGRARGARRPGIWVGWTPTVSASAGRWRRRTSAPSSAGCARSCRRTSRGTCWASPSPMTCSRRSGPERTPSTASRPHGWPA